MADWKLFEINRDAWLSMLSDCARAKKSIVLEQFIFVNDEFGQKLINVCAERAKEGVIVRFLWDAAGSFTFWGSGIVENLAKKGIELVFWKTLIPGYYKVPDYRSWYLRNHRRTLVIDNEIGYTGSICVENDKKNWRDTNVRMTGPVVLEMTSAFERMWARAKRIRKLPRRRHAHDPEFRYLTNFPSPGRRHIYAAVVDAIRQATSYVYITTPYFVPTRRLLLAIKGASERGCEVRLIVPERSDYYVVDLGARAFFNTLFQSGVKIFLYTGNMIHCKSVIVDGVWATVGSMNMDSVSLLYNFEANIITTNAKFIGELKRHFAHDLEEARQVIASEWYKRFFLEKIPEKLIRLVT